MQSGLRLSLHLPQHRGGIAPSFPSMSRRQAGGEFAALLPAAPGGQMQRLQALVLLLLPGTTWDLGLGQSPGLL